MEKIHVLHVVGMMDFGGTEALLMNLLRTIDRKQFQFDFVEQVQDPCAHDPEILSLGSKIYRCPHIKPTNLRAYRRWWRNFFAAHPEYQIIHGHSRGSAPIYMREAHRAGRIVIAHCHSSSYGLGASGLVRELWQMPLRSLGDYNFACSLDAGYSQYGRHRPFEVIQNGIITECFAWNESERKEIRAEYRISERALVVGNVARFETPKNHAFLIQLFAALHRQNPNSVLMLVGEGTMEQQLRAKVRELALDDCVIFTGSKHDVYRYYQAMDVFVLPSHYEGLPLVAMEAQAAGLPCFISEKVVAPECKVTDLVHFIPLEHSPQQWAEEILRMLAAQPPRTDRSQEVKDAGFDITDTARKLCDFYRRVLKNCG